MEELDERKERIKTRIDDPKKYIENFFLKTDFSKYIEEHKRLIKEILSEPYKKYNEFKNRLILNGADANFPELGGVFYYLIDAIYKNELIYNFLKKDEYNVIYNQILNKIIGIDVDGRFNFPYRSTIYCIESLLEILDLYYRMTIKPVSGALPNENIGPYYHIFRYRYYLPTLTDSKFGIPNNIVFPTFYNIGTTDLIKIRCVPILILGVSDKPVYVDQYINTPLDFFAHDIQHNRRQIHETLRYYDLFIKHNKYFKNRSFYDLRTEDSFYKYMEKFTKEVILPIITFDPADTDEVKAYKQLKKILIFEVVHEKAWPITKKSLCRNIILKHDEFPIETIHYDEAKKKISILDYSFSDPTTLGNVIGKLRNGFYDKINATDKRICKVEYRTSKHLSIAARELLNEIKCSSIPSPEYILALTTDRQYMQEFQDIPSITIEDDPKIALKYPVEPSENLYDDTKLYTTNVKLNPEKMERGTLLKEELKEEYKDFISNYEMDGGYKIYKFNNLLFI